MSRLAQLLLLTLIGGIMASTRLGYDSVAACFFELADLSHDGVVTKAEMQVVFDRWITRFEQGIDQLTPDTLLAQCDTDNSQQITWKEMTGLPHCLTITQTAGLARWLCSKARHGNFIFDGFAQVEEAFEIGILSGHGFKSVQTQYALMLDSVRGEQRDALARTHNTTRFSSEIDDLISDAGSFLGQPLALGVSVIIVAFALIVACAV